MKYSCGCPLDAAVLKALLRLNGVIGGDTDEAAARPGCIGGGKVACCVYCQVVRRGKVIDARTGTSVSSGSGLTGGGAGGGRGIVQSLRSDSSHLHGVLSVIS